MKTILIIEDDQKIGLALCIRFKAHGYATWLAGDGITGLNLAVRQKPALIVLDISLPAGNGFALAGQLQQLPETRNVPIIFATASNDPELRKKVLELGAAGLVRKPYEAQTMLAMVNHVLKAHPPIDSEALRALPNRSVEKKKSMPKRILIVEDDQKLAMALAVRMKAAGFETTVANDGLSGVQAAINAQPDAVVLDISLPAGDGFAVAERIQSNVPTPMPIIFLTASKRPDFRERAYQLGAVGFFEKPYEAQGLLAALNRALA